MSNNSENIEKLRVIIISAAHVHAESYVRALSARPDVIVALSDSDGRTTTEEGPRGEDLARIHGIAHVPSDQIWEWNPDAVVICSENVHHRMWVDQAAAHHAHVLCEKPLATSLDDARAMVTAARNAGVNLMTAYPMRFAPEFRELLRAVRAGALGEIRSIRGTNNGKIPAGRAWFTDADLAGGGALTDHVVHCADLIDELLGEVPTSAYAVANDVIGRSGARIDVETAGFVALRYPSDVIATIDCSWSRPQSAARWGDLTLTVEGTNATMTIAPFASGVQGQLVDGDVWRPYGADTDALMIDEFIASIREQRAPWPDGEAGERTTRVVDASYRSVREGAPAQIAR